MKKILFTLLITFSFLNLISQTKTENKIIKKISNNNIVKFDILIDSLYKSNQPIDFNATLIDDKNKVLNVNGSINYYLFEVLDSNSYINNLGQLVLNLRKIKVGETISINFILKQNKNISSIIKIPANYKGHLVVDYSGKNGANGKPGECGHRDQNNQLILGNGEKGKDGSKGENGHKISVTIDICNIALLKKDMLKITVEDSNTKSSNCFYADTTDFSITFDISGGNGGNGGLGGRGGKGDPLSVTSLNDYNTAKDGKYGGNGGNGGQGGDCGKIHFIFNSSTEKFKTKIEVIAKGGLGGKPGKAGARGEPGDLIYQGKAYSAEHFWRQSKSECLECYENPGNSGLDGQCTEIIY